MILLVVVVLCVLGMNLALGRRIYKWGSWHCTLDFPAIQIHTENLAFIKKIWLPRPWFVLGSWVTLLIVLPSLYLLLGNLWTLLATMFGSAEAPQPPGEPQLQVIVPGYNLPASDFGYYALTLLFISLMHELGHAAAARAEYIDPLDVGFMVFGIVPMAFVNLPSQDLNAAPTWSKLRTLTAGVWHNVVLSFLAYLVLIALPWLLAPAFASGSGVHVLSVAPASPVRGPSGLEPGDVITAVNGCPTATIADFRTCIGLATRHPVGWCLKASTRPELGSKCTPGDGEMCFRDVDEPEAAPLALKVRQELENSPELCNATYRCPEGRRCLQPTENLTQVNRNQIKDFLFVGDPTQIYLDVEVSNYQLRLGPFGLNGLPSALEKFCYYVVVLSSALAVVNAVPCWRLDGCLILETVLESSLRSPGLRRKLFRVTTHLGTLILALNVILGLFNVIL